MQQHQRHYGQEEEDHEDSAQRLMNKFLKEKVYNSNSDSDFNYEISQSNSNSSTRSNSMDNEKPVVAFKQQQQVWIY